MPIYIYTHARAGTLNGMWHPLHNGVDIWYQMWGAFREGTEYLCIHTSLRTRGIQHNRVSRKVSGWGPEWGPFLGYILGV